MKILVCGSRTWNNSAIIYDILSKLPKDIIIIHGAAPGADRLAAKIAEEQLGLKVIPFPAKWNRYKKSAGHIRNLEMANENPDKIIAFWDGISSGTKDMMEIAEKGDIPVDVIMESTFQYGVEGEKMSEKIETTYELKL